MILDQSVGTYAIGGAIVVLATSTGIVTWLRRRGDEARVRRILELDRLYFDCAARAAKKAAMEASEDANFWNGLAGLIGVELSELREKEAKRP